jgi:vesicle coat complex subunit
LQHDLVLTAFQPICHLQVQLQLLTATVKLFLKKPTDSVQRMIQLVLSAATNETDNPDLRDRAYVYWRLLSTDPEVCTRQLDYVGIRYGT